MVDAAGGLARPGDHAGEVGASAVPRGGKQQRQHVDVADVERVGGRVELGFLVRGDPRQPVIAGVGVQRRREDRLRDRVDALRAGLFECVIEHTPDRGILGARIADRDHQMYEPTARFPNDTFKGQHPGLAHRRSSGQRNHDAFASDDTGCRAR
ncbi:MAG: hypothetical protein M5T61_16310 [Acidimicrobiia bacterium]|nr:hypothetical protein [Acidimicrobiia bacterium]